MLWHADLGDAPRYGTARCAAAMRELRSEPGLAGPRRPRGCRRRSPTTYRWTCSASSPACPPARRASRGTAQPSGSSSTRRTAPGHAALLDRGTPGSRRRRHALRRVRPDARRLDRHRRPDRGLPRRAAAAGGRGGRRRRRHPGSRVASAEPIRSAPGSSWTARYVHALRDGRAPDDPRIGPSAKPGWEWVSDIHAGQAQRLDRSTRTRRDVWLAIEPKTHAPSTSAVSVASRAARARSSRATGADARSP